MTGVKSPCIGAGMGGVLAAWAASAVLGVGLSCAADIQSTSPVQQSYVCKQRHFGSSCRQQAPTGYPWHLTLQCPLRLSQ
jgi:hypothetical protein